MKPAINMTVCLKKQAPTGLMAGWQHLFRSPGIAGEEDLT
jgi:hypothetical protein